MGLKQALDISQAAYDRYKKFIKKESLFSEQKSKTSIILEKFFREHVRMKFNLNTSKKKNLIQLYFSKNLFIK